LSFQNEITLYNEGIGRDENGSNQMISREMSGRGDNMDRITEDSMMIEERFMIPA